MPFFSSKLIRLSSILSDEYFSEETSVSSDKITSVSVGSSYSMSTDVSARVRITASDCVSEEFFEQPTSLYRIEVNSFSDDGINAPVVQSIHYNHIKGATIGIDTGFGNSVVRFVEDQVILDSGIRNEGVIGDVTVAYDQFMEVPSVNAVYDQEKECWNIKLKPTRYTQQLIRFDPIIRIGDYEGVDSAETVPTSASIVDANAFGDIIVNVTYAQNTSISQNNLITVNGGSINNYGYVSTDYGLTFKQSSVEFENAEAESYLQGLVSTTYVEGRSMWMGISYNSDFNKDYTWIVYSNEGDIWKSLKIYVPQNTSQIIYYSKVFRGVFLFSVGGGSYPYNIYGFLSDDNPDITNGWDLYTLPSELRVLDVLDFDNSLVILSNRNGDLFKITTTPENITKINHNFTGYNYAVASDGYNLVVGRNNSKILIFDSINNLVNVREETVYDNTSKIIYSLFYDGEVWHIKDRYTNEPWITKTNINNQTEDWVYDTYLNNKLPTLYTKNVESFIKTPSGYGCITSSSRIFVKSNGMTPTTPKLESISSEERFDRTSYCGDPNDLGTTSVIASNTYGISQNTDKSVVVVISNLYLIYYSIDNGNSWNPAIINNPNNRFLGLPKSITFNPIENLWYVLFSTSNSSEQYSLIATSADGMNWTVEDVPYYTSIPSSIIYHQAADAVCIVSKGSSSLPHIHYKNSNTSAWNVGDIGIYGGYTTAASDGTTLILSGSNGRTVYATTDLNNFTEITTLSSLVPSSVSYYNQNFIFTRDSYDIQIIPSDQISPTVAPIVDVPYTGIFGVAGFSNVTFLNGIWIGKSNRPYNLWLYKYDITDINEKWKSHSALNHILRYDTPTSPEVFGLELSNNILLITDNGKLYKL